MPEFTASSRAALAAPAVSSGVDGSDDGSPPATEPETPTTSDAAVAYRQDADSMTLEWDAAPGPVSSYRIYVREHPNGRWTLLDEITATAAPSYEVARSATGDGSFDFAVSSVDGEGTESVKHTSLDDEADPPSGWYVIWESSP